MAWALGPAGCLGWRDDLLLSLAIPWARRMSDGLRPIASHVTPKSPTLRMFSDYSGQHASSEYETYSFLILDELDARCVAAPLAAWRANSGLGLRRLSYKQLGDKRRRAALPDFLNVWDDVPGLCITVAVEKALGRICTGPRSLQIWRAANLNGFKFKASALEKASRICHFASILLSLVATPRQCNLNWISDEDDIMANDDALQGVLLMFAKTYALYTSRPMGVLAGNTPSVEGDSALLLEDCVALPDLAAGAVANLTNSHLTSLSSTSVGDLLAPGSPYSDKADPILDWQTTSGGRLHRAFVVLRSEGKGMRMSVVQRSLEVR